MSVRVISDKVAKFMMVMAATWAFILTFIIMADIIGRGAGVAGVLPPATRE